MEVLNWNGNVLSLGGLLDLLYVFTSSASDFEDLNSAFELDKCNLQLSLLDLGYPSIDHLIPEKAPFVQVYIRKVNNVYKKYYFNKEGYKRIADTAVMHIDSICTKPKPDYVEIPSTCAFLFEDRFSDDIIKGRIAMVALMSARYAPKKPILISTLDRLINIYSDDSFNNFYEFWKHFFPGIGRLSSALRKYCWNDIEMVEDNKLIYVVDLIDFIHECMKFTKARHELQDTIDSVTAGQEVTHAHSSKESATGQKNISLSNDDEYVGETKVSSPKNSNQSETDVKSYRSLTEEGRYAEELGIPFWLIGFIDKHGTPVYEKKCNIVIPRPKFFDEIDKQRGFNI